MKTAKDFTFNHRLIAAGVHAHQIRERRLQAYTRVHPFRYGRDFRRYSVANRRYWKIIDAIVERFHFDTLQEARDLCSPECDPAKYSRVVRKDFEQAQEELQNAA